MFKQRLFLAAVSAFLVGVIVSMAYMITSGMFNPMANFALSNSWATEETAETNWAVAKDTVVRKQSIYLCGDIESEEESNAKALMGMNHSELLQMFGTKDGWQVQFLSPQELILARRINELCPEHKGYRHLAIYQEKLAVFEGPLGIDNKMLVVFQDKSVQSLPQLLQLKIQQASDFHKQDAETQAKLRQELEFSTEKELNAMLENMDELD